MGDYPILAIFERMARSRGKVGSMEVIEPELSFLLDQPNTFGSSGNIAFRR